MNEAEIHERIVKIQSLTIDSNNSHTLDTERRTNLHMFVMRANDNDVQKFSGNATHSDHFKLLERDGDSFLVGARNIVYNISLVTLDENKRLEWYSNPEDIRLCRVKGKSADDCQNYVRVLAKTSDSDILVCGTNSFKPRCRHYMQTLGGYEMAKEVSGEGLCPYDPHHNSTAVFAEANLYVATVAQFSGADPLIYREPLRTEQFNPKHLNAPSFVSSLHHEDHVFFFFRETAVEYINCGKKVYSRVARVCTKDKGGPHKFKKHWTSFLKARLNCSIPGDFPFYFNEILIESLKIAIIITESTTGIVEGVYNGKSLKIIYGVFTTPPNSVGVSAVCAFRMQDIYEVFNGPFKGQENPDSNWLAVQSSKVPEPRPGQCVNDSRLLPETTLNFLKDHALMDLAVPSFWKSPVVIVTSMKYRFTQIAVDPQLETVSGKNYDVLFIATDDGRVIKAINSASCAMKGHHNHNQVVPVIIEDITVFPQKTAITNLMVYRTYYEAKLVVVSENEIKSIPLFKCESRADTCGKCVALQDPYCAWDIADQRCTSSRKRYWNRENFVQNIEDGWDPKCPDGRPFSHKNEGVIPPQTEQHTHTNTKGGTVNINENNVDNSNKEVAKTSQIYSGETFAFAVVTSVVTSLVVGFIFGYIFSRRCHKDDPSVCSPYDDPTTFLDNHRQIPPDNYAALGQGPNNKPINLVLNVPPKNGKNANSSADNKPIQKVKKIYL
ncbi:semaphorin-1A-like isoform X2 [Dinothrombium tinctorium]|uniref:Semaphorin-1A n=1 Tax=Dinothrombium tinctorium TaxID=1965070 RepID=A0A3S3PQU2_9ACAR|nr:semaphorin-1A-like isoform X2 [Dinothrombium tinctorium]